MCIYECACGVVAGVLGYIGVCVCVRLCACMRVCGCECGVQRCMWRYAGMCAYVLVCVCEIRVHGNVCGGIRVGCVHVYMGVSVG